MFKIYTATNFQQQGGAKNIKYNVYCGSKVQVPKGKVRGRPNECFMLGRRAGFYAGILKGRDQGFSMPQSNMPTDIYDTVSKALIPVLPTRILTEREKLISTSSGQVVAESFERSEMMREDILSRRTLNPRMEKKKERKKLLKTVSGTTALESLERGEMMREDISSRTLRQQRKPSIKELYRGVPKSTRIRDFMATLTIRNPEFNYGGSQYKSVKQKKELGTEGLKRWLIDVVGEYTE